MWYPSRVLNMDAVITHDSDPYRSTHWTTYYYNIPGVVTFYPSILWISQNIPITSSPLIGLIIFLAINSLTCTSIYSDT